MPLSSPRAMDWQGRRAALSGHTESRGEPRGPGHPSGRCPAAPCLLRPARPQGVWAEFSLGGSGLVTLHLVTGVFLEDSWGGAWRSPKCGLRPRERLRAWWASPREPTRLCPLTRLPALSERDGGPFFAVLWSGREAGDEAEDSEVL